MTKKTEKSWLRQATKYFNNPPEETEEEKKQRAFKETKWQMLRIDLQLLESNLLKRYSKLGKKVYRESKTEKTAKNKALLRTIEKNHTDIKAKKKEIKILETAIQASREKNSAESEILKKDKTRVKTKFQKVII